MKYEDLKREFGQLTKEERQRFMEEVGLGLCNEMMSDAGFIKRMMPRCMEMMGHLSAPMRQLMQEWMAGAKKS